MLSVLFLSQGYIFSRGRVEQGGADGAGGPGVKPELTEECRRCFWRAGVGFGEQREGGGVGVGADSQGWLGD